MQTTAIDDTVGHLNSFLRGELSAVETYEKALTAIDDSTPRITLEACERSNEQRARLLAEEVRRRGGEPASSSGVWGAFAKLVEAGATVLGPKAAIAALEEGEDHGRDDYRRDIDLLDAPAKELVPTKGLPQPMRTQQGVSGV